MQVSQQGVLVLKQSAIVGCLGAIERCLCVKKGVIKECLGAVVRPLWVSTCMFKNQSLRVLRKVLQ